MDASIQIALIMSSSAVIVGCVPGLMAAATARGARRAAERAEKHAEETKAITVEVAHRIDGRMDELVETTRQMAYAAGLTDQKETDDTIAEAVKAAQTPTVVIAQPQMPSAIQRQGNDAKNP